MGEKENQVEGGGGGGDDHDDDVQFRKERMITL